MGAKRAERMAVTPTGRERQPIAAEAFLRALADHGTDYFFCNPGTDFPPIVEAFDRAKKTNAKVPKPVLVPHENLAVAMAHGAYLMNGRPQAVMVHVNVGTANTINNLTNLSRDRVPLILCAGRTPITEKGSFGSRSRPIHWAQEMFDQAGMLRELVKWDYELRMPSQIGDVVSRAVDNPNEVFIRVEFPSVEQARTFRERLIGSGAMERGRMRLKLGPTVAEVADATTY